MDKLNKDNKEKIIKIIQEISMKQDFFIEIKLPILSCKKENMNTIFINNNIWKLLSEIKEKIDSKDIKEWDNVKKLTNDYELIYLSSRCRESDSIANIKPLSRSYFKMIEILKECEIPLCNNITCGHLAEGPGGFIQATVDTLNKHNYKYICHGITLRSTEHDIPGWNKAKQFIKHNNVKIHYGVDKTGNLYNKDNILHFVDSIGKKCEIVTADGGFDFSGDFNKQEEMSYRLLLCETVANLLIQKENGYFVIKFFDIFTKLTLQIIYLIGMYYESFTIIKPKTSRMANSEKYIIFKKFKGCPLADLESLLYVIHNTKDYNKLSLFEDFETLSFMDTFIENISNFNEKFSLAQKKSIEKTLDILNNKIDIVDNIKMKCEKYQIQKAKEWCEKYSIPINYYSNFLK